ncbi:MAG: DUF3347 domain-containing protein [Bacteroidota bacterium]
MKNTFMGLAVMVIALTACNNSNTKEEKKTNDTANTAAMAAPVTGGSSVKDVVEHYLHIKNALTKDDGKEAANGGKALADVFGKFDQSSLTAEQKKTFTDIQADAKEHAEHISVNAEKIAHQREHFATLSKDVYDLVKSLGGGQTLYNDFCPMYNNNKGATWLSETKDIKNPYLGKAMPTCGNVKETIQ